MTTPQQLFTLTTLKMLQPSNIDHVRTVGVFLTVADAIDVVERNVGDIYEAGYYPYAVIEAIPPGLYPIVEQQWWFRWAGDGYHAFDGAGSDERVSFSTIG